MSENHQKPEKPATATAVLGRYLFKKGPAAATTATGESTKGLFSDFWLFVLSVAAFIIWLTEPLKEASRVSWAR